MTILIVNDTISFPCEEVGNLQGFEYPTVNMSVEDVSGMSGAVYINSKFGRRELSWEGVIKEMSLLSRRNLITVCRAGSLKTIMFETCDGLALQAEVEFKPIVMPYVTGQSRYLLSAVAPDSRFYSQELVSVDIAQTSIRGGTSIPFPTIPVAITQSDLTDEELNAVVTNEGSEETEPIYVIQGPGTGFTVTNVTTGEEFFLSTTLAEGEYITVDVRQGTVTLNGVSNIYDEFTGDFIELEPGDNQFEFTVASDIDVTTLLNVSYRSAYSGI